MPPLPDTNPLILQTLCPEQCCALAGIPIIAEIEPRPDPVYGHTFQWPEEVAQFLALPDSGGQS